jgi:hypothetical protein
MRIPARAVAYSACVFTLIFLMFRPLQGQYQAAPASFAGNVSGTQGSAPSAPANNTAPGKVTIFYTSQLFGYFRAPDVQPADSTEGCAATDDSESPAAKAFDVLWRDQTDPGKILVGTGNNLAPVLWGRQFDAKHFPENQYRGLDPKPEDAFKRTSKELFAWDPTGNPPQWVTNEQVAKEENEEREIQDETGKQPNPDSLPQRLLRGEGTIPTDNVACFLRRAGYTAIVPGKYDFYYGPERLRELARFLAGKEEPGGKPEPKFKPVEMLGANLVIETTWKSGRKPLADSEAPPWFIPRFPTAKDFVSNSDADIRFLGLADKGTVYPWFMGPTVHLSSSQMTAALNEAWNQSIFYLCKATRKKMTDPDDPNEIPGSFGSPLCQKLQPTAKPDSTGVSYQLWFPFSGNDSHLQPFLEPGANYGLCVDAPIATVKDSTGGHHFCVRFSVYTPFFQFPLSPKTKCAGTDGTLGPCYNDPDPYKLVTAADNPGLGRDVAIFGVVDPNLGQDVGMLNFAWSNYNDGSDDKKYKTETTVKDPGEALHEIVAYFERKYKVENHGQEFSGLKILLAQMTPEEAQKLAARVGKFDVVVSDADPQLSGVGETRIAKWERAHPDPEDRHAFLAVPQPYWVSDKKPKERVDLGKLTIDIDSGETQKTFIATHEQETNPPGLPENPPGSPALEAVTAPKGFWKAAVDYINTRCGAGFKPQTGRFDDSWSDSEKQTVLQSLTACTMQQEIGADVVLMQKRDFYMDWQQRPDPLATLESFQQFLDRVIWKGDFLTLLYVPGSTLQSVMKQSKAFDDDDKSLLSLASEKDRGLVAVGIRQDSKSGGYLINEAPLDPMRVYAVAASDFAAAGDTGYPDLAANAIRQFSAPEDFDSHLKNISAAVCQELPPPPRAPHSPPPPPPLDSGGKSAGTCMDAIDRDSYFDELAVSPNDTRPNGWGHQLWQWSVLDPSKRVPGANGKKSASNPPPGIETYVEQRRLGSTRINPPDTSLFAINDAALSLNMLNHKLSDAGLAQTFVGNPTPQLSAKRSHAAGYDIQPKFLYSWHSYQIFENTEMVYNVQDTGNLNQARTVNQKENLFSSDTGFARDITDRTLPHWEILGTFHYETQLWTPTPVTLAPLPKGDAFLPGVNTRRTHYFLPRLGVRYVNRTSWIEAGMESGGELQAVRLVAPPPGGTQFGLSRPNINVSGTYWKWHLVVPFGGKVSWTEDEDGDYFFNQGGDAKTDTRFRSDTKTAVNFQVFPSLAFAPTYEFFYYSNKVQGDWFWQNQASIQMKVRFDFWNRNRVGDQFKYKAVGGSQ